jgi:hypothetical protein
MATRAAGLLAGLCLVAVVALGAWRVRPSAQPAGVEADLRAVSSGEVGVEPSGPVVRRGVLTPGGPAVRGRVRLSNRTAGALAARPHLTGGDPALDRFLEVELRVAGRLAFRGPLGRLRDAAAPVASLPRGGHAVVDVALRVPASAGSEATARAGHWTLTFSGGTAR